jgi:hypothetical protein
LQLQTAEELPHAAGDGVGAGNNYSIFNSLPIR